MASFLEATQAKAVGAPDVAALAERVARGLKRIQDTAHRRWKK